MGAKSQVQLRTAAQTKAKPKGKTQVKPKVEKAQVKAQANVRAKTRLRSKEPPKPRTKMHDGLTTQIKPQTQILAELDPVVAFEFPFGAFLQETFQSPDFEVLPLAGDASSRKYYRVIKDDQSWVLMAWEPFESTADYPFLSVLNHFKKHRVSVPFVHRISPQNGWILLEDLGDLTLERKFWESLNPDVVLPYYIQAVDELIKIHFECSNDQKRCTAFGIAFDTAKFLWEMNYGREHLFEKLAKLVLSPKESQALDKVFFDICQKLDREKKYISHRDYHSRNLMIKLGSVRVIDFQDARLGPVQYDLVSLLCDSYVNLQMDFVDSVLDDYLDKARDFGFVQSRDEFDSVFELQSIQRCFKACGSFASFFNLRNDTRYLKYLGPTLQRVHQTLDRYPDYRPFQQIIEDRGLLEMDFTPP